MSPEPQDPWRDRQITAKRYAIYEDYVAWMRERRQRQPAINESEFHKMVQDVLSSQCFRSKQVKRPKSGGERETLLLLASLHDCRAAYDKHVGYPHEWADAVPAGIDDAIEDDIDDENEI
jgi:hypothetical protein